MKRDTFFLTVFAMTILSLQTVAQVSPYQIPPKWMFGYQAGFDFGTSPYTISPPNVLTGNPTNNGSGSAADAVGGMEASTSVCSPASNLVFYTNFFRYYNSANTGFAYPGAAPSGSGSATDGGVAVPDPANPTTQYYVFVANDITGGGAGTFKGVNYYKVSTPVTAASVTGPTNLAAASDVDEALCAGSDGSGGYWIVAHGRAASNGTSFLVWHVTASGVTALAAQPAPNPGGVFPSPANNNNIGAPTASMKISRCQDRIAYVVGSFVEVYEWNRNTGQIGNVLYRQNGIACCASYGLEFSPSGNYVFFTELNGGLKRVDVSTATGAPVTVATGSSNSSCSELGTMQLGPDNKIYVTTCGFAGGYTGVVYLGVIHTPDLPAHGYSGNGYTLKAANASQYPTISRGIANMAWMSPQTPTITLSSGGTCSQITHTIDFKTYFNTQISLPSSPLTAIQWSFDNGATWVNGNGTNSYTHDYGGSGATTARVRFYDQVCNNYQWTASVAVSTSCPAPVNLINFKGEKAGTDVLLTWTTLTETNNNYFEVQRSTDGIHFSSIGTVQGNGTTEMVSNYSFIDENPSSGMNYYRLIQHDFDGQVTSSPVVLVDMGGTGIEVSVFPNPASENFHIRISGGVNVYLIVTDILGREVYKSEISEDKRDLLFGEDLSDGTYMLQVISEGDMQVVKVVKE